jgi:hypothetical protein
MLNPQESRWLTDLPELQDARDRVGPAVPVDLSGTFLFRRVEVYAFTDEDGTRAAWNATLGREIAERERSAVHRFNPRENGIDRDHIEERYPDLDWEYAANLGFFALARPLLFVPWKGKAVLIDGWHRLAKCVLMGGFDIPAYLLTQEQADRCRVEEATEAPRP